MLIPGHQSRFNAERRVLFAKDGSLDEKSWAALGVLVVAYAQLPVKIGRALRCVNDSNCTTVEAIWRDMLDTRISRGGHGSVGETILFHAAVRGLEKTARAFIRFSTRDVVLSLLLEPKPLRSDLVLDAFDWSGMATPEWLQRERATGWWFTARLIGRGFGAYLKRTGKMGDIAGDILRWLTNSWITTYWPHVSPDERDECDGFLQSVLSAEHAEAVSAEAFDLLVGKGWYLTAVEVFTRRVAHGYNSEFAIRTCRTMMAEVASAASLRAPSRLYAAFAEYKRAYTRIFGDPYLRNSGVVMDESDKSIWVSVFCTRVRLARSDLLDTAVQLARGWRPQLDPIWQKNYESRIASVTGALAALEARARGRADLCACPKRNMRVDDLVGLVLDFI